MNLPSGKLMALVAVFAAIGVITGTGAFTTVQAERTADVSVAGDSSALLAISSGSGDNANEYFSQSGGTAQIDLSSNNGNGVNLRALTSVENVFVIENQGSQPVAVTLSISDNNNNNEADDSTTEASAVRFAVPKKYTVGSSDWKLDEKSGQFDSEIPFAESNNKDLEQISNVDSAAWGGKSIVLDPGEAIQVGIYIDTSQGTDFNSDIGGTPTGNLANNKNSDDLIDSITIYANADKTTNAGFVVKEQSSPSSS